MRNRRCRYDELNANIRDCARKRLVVVSPSPKLVALLEEKNRQRVSFSLSIFSFSLFFQLPPPFQLPSVEGSSLSLTLIRTYRSGIGDRGGSMKGKVPHEGGGHLVVYRTSSWYYLGARHVRHCLERLLLGGMILTNFYTDYQRNGRTMETSY